MSRISGVLAPDLNTGTRLAADLSTRLAANENWVQATRRISAATVSWTGWAVPVCAERDGVVAVVDGIFFNREELDSARSVSLEAPNDADRLVAAFLDVGFESALNNINGDFAVALYDNRDQALWLGRDRFGVKPLYYGRGNEFFAFASTPLALTVVPGISRRINRRFAAVFAGGHYRYIDNRPAESPYEDISQLPASSWLRLDEEGMRTGCYWRLEEEQELAGSEAQLAEQYRSLLIDAVGRRLAVAPEPAFTLSGGLDSSTVVSCAVEVAERPQHAFSTVYTDKTYDESQEIASMLEHKVQEWHPMQVGTPDVFDLLEKMVLIHEEPVVTATWLSHYLLCNQVSESGFGSLFGGLGGDELNAGEYEYFFYHFADLFRSGNESRLANEIECWVEHHDHPIFRKNRAVVDAIFSRSIDFNNPGHCFPDRDRLSRYFGTIQTSYFDLNDFEPELDHPFTSYLKNRTYQDLFRETAPCCLRAEDRQTSAFGLNHIDPFFDYRLAEFMFRVPGSMKIRDGITKRLLREAMKGILPEETRVRIKKTGWNAPAHAWFGEGRNSDRLGDLIGSRAFKERGIYNVSEVEKLFREHCAIVESGDQMDNHMMFFWQMIGMETWFKLVESKGGDNG